MTSSTINVLKTILVHIISDQQKILQEFKHIYHSSLRQLFLKGISIQIRKKAYSHFYVGTSKKFSFSKCQIIKKILTT